MKNITLTLLCMLFAWTARSQTTIYLNSSTGNDATGNGTAGNPYKTFYKGYTVAAAGDILNLTGTFSWTDAAETGDAANTGYTLAKNLTVTGQGQTATFIQAHTAVNSADRRVFTVNAGITVTFNDLTIRYGRPTAGYNGGGIENSGTVVLNRCRLNQNYVNVGSGGSGGGLNNIGTATVNSCLVDYNKCIGQGGGLENYYTAANTNTLTVTNSTVVFNTQAYSVATVGGAGICFRSGTGYITNSTIAFNDNTLGGTATSAGIAALDAAVRIYLKNSIIAMNKVLGGYIYLRTDWFSDLYADYAGIVTDNGGNIYGKYYNFTPANTSWYDQAGSGAGNQVYTKYGSATTGSLYMNTSLADCAAPYATSFIGFSNFASVAVNNGTSGNNGAVAVPATDQRGMSRLGTADIGAYEYSVYTWTGTTSTDWGTAGNWAENEVPASYADIVIPGSYTNAPMLDQNRTITAINLASGSTLTLNAKTLNLHGSISGTGVFYGDNAAILNFVNTGGGGTLYLSNAVPGSSDVLNTLSLNRSSGNTVTLGSNMSTGTLTLSTGIIDVGTYSLTVTSLSGGSASAYVKTSSTGILKTSISNGSTVVMPVGNSGYNPVSITNNSGAADNFSVNVIDEAYMNSVNGTIVTSSHINRTWNIGKDNPNGGSGINFVFNWNAGEKTGIIVVPSLYHYTGTNWNIETNGSTSSTATSLTYSGYTGSFSPFAVIEGSYILPVSWLGFSGKKEGTAVSLAWRTENEKNSNQYLVQHNTDGISWKTIGTVQAAGTTLQSTSYSFLHQDPARGINYYRLVQKDLDGRMNYSSVVKVMNDDAKGLKAYPTVVTDRNLVVITQSQGVVGLYDANGIKVWQKVLPVGSNTVVLPELKDGFYLLRSADGTVPLMIR